MLSWKAEVRRDLTSRLSGSFAQQQQITLKSLFCRSLSDVSLYSLLFTNWSCSCGRVFYAMCRLTCLKEWVIWLFPEVKKRFRITLMSWLSVWICSDLRTLVRGRGGAGKETWNREWSLFCLQFEKKIYCPTRREKGGKTPLISAHVRATVIRNRRLLSCLCSFFPLIQTWNQQILIWCLNFENLAVIKQFWHKWKLQLLIHTLVQTKLMKYWHFIPKCFA